MKTLLLSKISMVVTVLFFMAATKTMGQSAYTNPLPVTNNNTSLSFEFDWVVVESTCSFICDQSLPGPPFSIGASATGSIPFSTAACGAMQCDVKITIESINSTPITPVHCSLTGGGCSGSFNGISYSISFNTTTGAITIN